MERYTTRSPKGRMRPIDRVELGPHVPEALTRRLIGEVDARRVLELGCGCGNSSVAMSAAGAKVIAVDDDHDQLTAARELAEAQEVRIEVHHSDLADLAFLGADSIDAAISVYELSDVKDLDRVFRQVHRVLRTDAHFVISLVHPIAMSAGGRYDESTGPTVASVFTGLTRANFLVDNIAEVIDPLRPAIPETLVVRGRKQGV